MAAKKRRAQEPTRTDTVIDLTSTVPADEEESEAEATMLVASTQDEELMLYGILHTKIVGVRYYTGTATLGEVILPRRQPSNPHDSNAIRVDNVRGEQIGHLPRTMAAKLSKYVDTGVLRVEGRLTGRKGTFDCPVGVALYGPSDPVETNLRGELKRDGLPTGDLDRQDKMLKRKRAEELKIAAKRAKVGSGDGMSDIAGVGWGVGAGQGQEMDDILDGSEMIHPHQLRQLPEKFGMSEADLATMPMAACPKELSTQLLPYQRQALAWLLEHESPRLPRERDLTPVQLWKRSEEKGLFTNIATNFSMKGMPGLANGGVLSDDMGLGKTIEMISLVIADTKRTKQPTLVVAPVGLMSNWSGQIAAHVKLEHALKVLTYHGASRKQMTADELAEYDVVITSYGTLVTEYLPKREKTAPKSARSHGLFAVSWRRVILDEGHTIRNPQTKAALAATNLTATSRWVLTGTPIINSLKDLFSLVRFIRLTGGLEQLEIFNSVLIRPLKSGDPHAKLLLQALMATICLRRKKDMSFVDLKLPEIKEYIHRMTFSSKERERYDTLQSEARGLLRTFRTQHANGAQKHASRGQDTYRHLLEVLLRLRQLCNHWHLCSSRVTHALSLLSTASQLNLTPENQEALQSMLQLAIDSREDCAICLDPLGLHDPVITTCAHVFGRGCIERVLEGQKRCPMCRAEPLNVDTLVAPAIESPGPVQPENEEDEDISSKITALLSILRAAHAKDRTTKTVIFSQWTTFLTILTPHLSRTFPNIHIARIDGSMSPSQRDHALHTFSTLPSCPVLLASLSVCSVGLNLVAANQVILSDSWWAPAIEDQAIDRVHRLGQTRPVMVWRLVVQGTVEEGVLGVQSTKRGLMAAAFSEKNDTGRDRGRLADMEKLLA